MLTLAATRKTSLQPDPQFYDTHSVARPNFSELRSYNLQVIRGCGRRGGERRAFHFRKRSPIRTN